MAKVVGASLTIVCSKHPVGSTMSLETISGERRFLTCDSPNPFPVNESGERFSMSCHFRVELYA